MLACSRPIAKWLAFAICAITISVWVFSLVYCTERSVDVFIPASAGTYQRNSFTFRLYMGHLWWRASSDPIGRLLSEAQNWFRVHSTPTPKWRCFRAPVRISTNLKPYHFGLALPTLRKITAPNGCLSTTIDVPLWAVLFPPAFLAVVLWRKVRRARPGHCSCGYDLTGNVSGVCSECGTHIESTGQS